MSNADDRSPYRKFGSLYLVLKIVVAVLAVWASLHLFGIL